MMKRVRAVVAAAGLLVAFVSSALAQPPAAQVAGTVSDGTGARLPGAEVRVESPAGALLEMTQADGSGEFRAGTAGNPEVRVVVMVAGFAPFIAERVEPGAVLDVRLEIRASDAVTVLATRSQLATKADTEVRLLPQSVTLVPAQVLADQQVDELSEVVRNVSGAVLAGNNVYGVRGIVSNSDGNFRKNGVEVWPAAPLMNQNVDRVEVLKGPASVLYGRLDPGGVINVVTKQPQAQTFRRLELRGGTFGYGEGRLDVTGPANRSRSLQYRLNVAYERRDSYRDEVGSDGLLVAPVLAWTLGSRARLTVEGEYQTDTQTNDPGLASPVASFASLDGMRIGTFLGEPDAEQALTQFTTLTKFEYLLPRGWQVRASASRANYDRQADTVGLAALQANRRTIARSALRREQDYGNLFGEALVLGAFATGRLQHRVTIGANAQRTTSDELQSRAALAPIDIFTPSYAGFPVQALARSASTEQTVDLYGVFVQDQMALGERWHVVLGGRLTEFEQRDANRIAGTGRRFTAREISPQVGLLFAPTRWASVYGSYAEGFKPTLNTDRAGRPFDPQFGLQWETGVKLDLLGGRLSTTAAYFWMDRTNQLSFILDPVTGLFDTRQGGKHRSSGIELDAQGALTASTSLVASYAWLDAKVVSDPAYLSGRPLGAAPVHSGSVWLTQRLGSRAGLGCGVFYQTEFKAFTSADTFVPGFTTGDAAAWYMPTPGLQLQLNVKNVANTRYYLTGAGSNIATPGGPRSAQLSLRYRF